MSRAEIIVTLAGMAAIAWVNWYFFIAGRDHGLWTTRRDPRDQRPGRRS